MRYEVTESRQWRHTSGRRRVASTRIALMGAFR